MAITTLDEAADAGDPFAFFLSVGTPHDPWGRGQCAAEWWSGSRISISRCPPTTGPKTNPPRWLEQVGRGTPRCAGRLDTRLLRHDGQPGLERGTPAGCGRLGLPEDTIVVFTSDHGEMFGAQGRRAKNIFYEEAVRIPFLLRWPGESRPTGQRRLPEHAGHHADAALPDGAAGSRCRRGDGPDPLRARPAGSRAGGRVASGHGRRRQLEDGHEWRALRDKRYTYAIYRVTTARTALRQPGRSLSDDWIWSVIPSYADTLERLRKLNLKMRMAELDDTFQACTWYRDHWTKIA